MTDTMLYATLPRLYSFRRCPFAMRARLALLYCHLPVRLREISLKHKPQQLLTISPKGTVPVLQLPDDKVIDESLDIVLWAIANAPYFHLSTAEHSVLCRDVQYWVSCCDREFKPQLDRYKYSNRFITTAQVQETQAQRTETDIIEQARQAGQIFLNHLCQCLDEISTQLNLPQHTIVYLGGKQPDLRDWSIMPFVRQYAAVDKIWWQTHQDKRLQRWLDSLLQHPLFHRCMDKFSQYQADQVDPIFPHASHDAKANINPTSETTQQPAGRAELKTKSQPAPDETMDTLNSAHHSTVNQTDPTESSAHNDDKQADTQSIRHTP